MNTIKAVCACKDMAETNMVLAVECRRFGFFEKWGCFTWLMVAILILATGGVWLGVIAGWHWNDLLCPKYHCNQCDAVITQKQFRS